MFTIYNKGRVYDILWIIWLFGSPGEFPLLGVRHILYKNRSASDSGGGVLYIPQAAQPVGGSSLCSARR